MKKVILLIILTAGLVSAELSEPRKEFIDSLLIRYFKAPRHSENEILSKSLTSIASLTGNAIQTIILAESRGREITPARACEILKEASPNQPIINVLLSLISIQLVSCPRIDDSDSGLMINLQDDGLFDPKKSSILLRMKDLSEKLANCCIKSEAPACEKALQRFLKALQWEETEISCKFAKCVMLALAAFALDHGNIPLFYECADIAFACFEGLNLLPEAEKRICSKLADDASFEALMAREAC